MASDFYNENEDYREFIDKNARTYGKTVEYMELTPTANEYKAYVISRDKGKGVQNEVKTYGC